MKCILGLNWIQCTNISSLFLLSQRSVLQTQPHLVKVYWEMIYRLVYFFFFPTKYGYQINTDFKIRYLWHEGFFLGEEKRRGGWRAKHNLLATNDEKCIIKTLVCETKLRKLIKQLIKTFALLHISCFQQYDLRLKKTFCKKILHKSFCKSLLR